MREPKHHRLSIQRTSDGQVAVAVDVFGPIGNPLEGLPLADKLRLLIRPYSRSERALMRAVKGLPTIVRRAVTADILSARREQMLARRKQRAERDLVEARMERTLAEPGSRVRLATGDGQRSTIQFAIDIALAEEPEMR